MKELYHQSLVMIWMAVMYIFFPFESAGRQWRSPLCNLGQGSRSIISRSIWVTKVKIMAQND